MTYQNAIYVSYIKNISDKIVLFCKKNIARLFGGRIVLIRYRSVPGHLLMQHLFARFVAGVKVYAVG